MGDLPVCWREFGKLTGVGKDGPQTQCAPLPLVGRGWGWGSRFRAQLARSNCYPPSLTLPHKGGGNTPERVRESAPARGRELRRSLGQRVDDAVDDLLDEGLVLAL